MLSEGTEERSLAGENKIISSKIMAQEPRRLGASDDSEICTGESGRGTGEGDGQGADR
tara:strand:- start:318 stop:491 length:174 start_codon:yes stop_codon:yes gene_type:complete